MLESFGQTPNVLVGKQAFEIGRFGRITPQQHNVRFVFECAGDLVACEQYGNHAQGSNHPLRQLSLGMGIRSINFVQNQTHGIWIVANQRCNAPCMLTRLHKGLYVCKASHGKTCVDFERFKSTGPSGCKGECGFSNSRRSVQHQHRRIGFLSQVRPDGFFYIRMPNNSVQLLRASGFTPHASPSYAARK